MLAASLWTAGAVGVWERDDELVAWFPSRDVDVPPRGRWEHEPDRDWTADWKAGLEPVTVGAVTVAPSWLAGGGRSGGDGGSTTVVIDPGMAFGTGHHATTRLCLAELQRVGVAERRVLDVGTGSGVLAIAAALLGASAVAGVDTDPDAVRVARENADRNGVRLELRTGSVGAVERPCDVVVANLVTDTILALAADLLAATADVLITSGISRGRAAQVADRFHELGAATHTTVEGDWAAVTATCWRARPAGRC